MAARAGVQSALAHQYEFSKRCCTENSHTPMMEAGIIIDSCTTSTGANPRTVMEPASSAANAKFVRCTPPRSFRQSLGASKGIR